jgi:hypothetical protein
MRYGVLAGVCSLAIAAALAARPAAAVKPFFEQFKALYVKSDTTDHTMKIFNLAVEKKQCTICHVKKAPHGKPFNAYGTQISKLLTKNNANDPKTIRAAMKKVEKIKTDPSDPKSPNFGTRLKQGKLPVGEIHVVPADDSSK